MARQGIQRASATDPTGPTADLSTMLANVGAGTGSDVLSQILSELGTQFGTDLGTLVPQSILSAF